MSDNQQEQNSPGSEPELKFPVDYPTCPVCGSTRLCIRGMADQEKAKGRMRKELPVAMMQAPSVIFDPNGTMLIAPPVVIQNIDWCYDCGTMRVVHAELGKAEMKMQPGPRPPGGMGLPPGFRRG